MKTQTLSLLLGLFLLLSGLQTFSLVTYRSRLADDHLLSVLVKKVDFTDTGNYSRLLAGNSVKNTFIAEYDNLGTLAFRFDNHHRLNSDWVWFRFKEVGEPDWYYEEKYNTDQFNPDYYFTIGFPVIRNSSGKNYEFELESISGTAENSISLHQDYSFYLAKYSFPKSFLLENRELIIPFIKNKLSSFLNYLAPSDIIKITLTSALPCIIWMLFFKLGRRIFRSVSRLKPDNLTFLKNDFLVSAVIFTLTLLVSGYFSTLGIDLHHDGILFKPAFDVASGKMLFRDTYTQYGALTTLIQGLGLIIFGKYLIVMKLSAALFYGLSSVLLYLISIKILPRFLSLVTVAVWLCLAPYYTWTFLAWSSVYALFFQLASALALLTAAEKKSLKFELLGGIFTALTFWCRQPVGVFLFLSIMVFYLFSKKSFTAFLKGNLYTSAAFLAWIIFNGALIDWWKQSIMFSFYWSQSEGVGFSLSKVFISLFPNVITPFTIWAVLPVWAVLPIGTGLLVIRNFKNKKILLLSLIGLASWLQYYPMSDVRHLYWAGTPMFPLLAALIYQLFTEFLNIDIKLTKNLAGIIASMVFIGIFWPEAVYRITAGQKKVVQPFVSIPNPSVLKFMRLSPSEATFYLGLDAKIQSYFAATPNGNVVAKGNNALYLTFDPRIKNIHRMYINQTIVNETIYQEYPAIINKYIEVNKPLLFD